MSPALQAGSLPPSHQESPTRIIGEPEKLAKRLVVASASELQAGTTLISSFWPPELNKFLSFQVTKFMVSGWPKKFILVCPYHLMKLFSQPNTLLGFLGGSMVKNPPANVGDVGLVPESGGFPGGGNGNPLLYSCLGNPMDRGVWQVRVHGVGHDLATEERQQMLCHSSPRKLTSW